ncbi:MAG: EamA family transporter [Patescibacteria group bacterium]
MNASLGLFLGILALVTMGLGNAISKKPIRTFGPNKLMFWRGIFMSVILLGIVLLTGQFAHFSLKYALITVVISFIGYWPLYFFYKGMDLGKVGIVSPVSSIYTVFTAFLAMVAYQDRLTATEIFAIAIIICGILLISIKFRDFKNSHLFQKSSGIYYALLAAIGWGIYFFLIRIPVMEMGAVLTSYLEETMMLGIVFIILLFNKDRVEKPTFTNIKPVLAISLLSIVGVMAYYQGIKIYSLSIMTALAAAGPLVVCIYGAFVYREKLELKQYIAIVIILFGIMMLR